VPNAVVFDFGLAQHRRMSPSARGSLGRRVYTPVRQSEGMTQSYLEVIVRYRNGKSLSRYLV
jgi:hypothetical protein